MTSSVNFELGPVMDVEGAIVALLESMSPTAIRVKTILKELKINILEGRRVSLYVIV